MNNVIQDFIIETTSTSAVWSPSLVGNTGDVLQWEVTGDATGSYTANDPDIDLSGNTGTAIIKVISTDNYAQLSTIRFGSLLITKANFGLATSLTSFWITNNATFNELTGFEQLVNLTDCRLNTNGLTGLLDLRNNTSLINCSFFFSNNFTSVNVTGRSNMTLLRLDGNPNLDNIIGLSDLSSLTLLNITNCKFSTLPTTGLTALQTLNISSNNLITNIDFSNITDLRTLGAAGAKLTAPDITPCPLLSSMNFFNNNLSVSGINNIIIDAAAKGIISGTRILTYTGAGNAAPTATENTTNDVLNAYNQLITDGWTVNGVVPA